MEALKVNEQISKQKFMDKILIRIDSSFVVLLAAFASFLIKIVLEELGIIDKEENDNCEEDYL